MFSIIANYISRNHSNEFELYFSKYGVKTSINFDEEDNNIFYVDYHPLESFEDNLNHYEQNVWDYIKETNSKVLIVTEGFPLFNIEEIFDKNINIENVAYWKIISCLRTKGVKEEQIYFISHNDGYHEEIKQLSNKKIVWINDVYHVRSKFLTLNPYLFLYQTKNTQDKKIDDIKFLFASLSNGRPSVHRYNFTKKLFEENIDKFGKISLVQMKGGDDNFDSKLPIIYDNKHNQWLNDADENYIFKDIFLWISNETFLGNKNVRGYSEKTIKSIFYKTPFLINGDTHILKHLQKDGFKTFETFWDEKYDGLTEINDRQQELIRILKDISKQDIRDLYENIKPIVEYNFNHLQKTDWSVLLENFLK